MTTTGILSVEIRYQKLRVNFIYTFLYINNPFLIIAPPKFLSFSKKSPQKIVDGLLTSV